ncbi:hypothetical protein PE066_02640 [Ramlibacter tataouinensis]|uniref:hypothetical protein n=1 Tax=Ramlibacter tataouinensis TaxID=94132 RepID=UPI0022F40693|nr:hypothetical protein [Ramlibacter tataouinensis]WBY02453.1 hypothetical protein PE066_02640 [Ramlibacter tataouinensis]
MNAQGPGSSTLSQTYAAGPAAQVNPDSAGRQTLLATGASAAGGHGIAWLSQGDGGLAATVHMRRFDAQGTAASDGFGTPVDLGQGRPAAAVLADGGFVVAGAVSGPASVDEPWVTRSAIRVQRFDGSGHRLADIDVGAVRQDRIGATTMRYVADPAVVRWPDGSFLVGWAQVEEDASGRLPQFWVQRFDAAGQPVGAPSHAATGEIDSGFQLTAAPSGGWVLTTFQRLMGRTALRYHPFEGASAPILPTGSAGMAEGSLLVPLQGGGSVVLSPVKVYGSLQLYGADGQGQGYAGTMPTAPVAATALSDGGFVVIAGDTASGMVAYRFDAQAQPVGDPVPVAAGADVQAAALAGGGLLLAWTTTVASGDTDVMAQRLR